VEQLADRPPGVPAEGHHPFYYLIPLNEILAELLSVGPNTKKVNKIYRALLAEKGSELNILHELPIETLNHSEIPLLGEAVRRVRKKEVQIFPGYDGAFGTIQLFTSREKENMIGPI
jgi:PHP family Zn ribbon phosphoesterase